MAVVSDRREWWGACALFAGVGAALVSGAAVATADTGAPSDHPGKSTAGPSSAKAASAASAKSMPRKATTARTLAAPVVRTSGLKAGIDSRKFSSTVSEPQQSAADSPRVATASPRAAAKVALAGPVAAVVDAPATNGVTGVKVGAAKLDIPCGSDGYVANARWYFPTQSDGSVQADGVIWLQHGFGAIGPFYSALATALAQQTNSIVVAPTLPFLPPLFCPDCWLNGAPMQEAIATMFLGSRAALNISANAAGYQGTLPEDFVMAGHSAGGGLATAVGGDYVADLGPDPTDNHLLGVVMFDGVSSNSSAFAESIANLDTLNIPDYTVAAPPQAWNAFGATTNELVSLRPGQFVGVELVGGSHVDSMLGTNPLLDFVLQLVTGFSPRGNTQAAYTLSSGWINDMYVGAGPSDPQYGIYGSAGDPIILGEAAGIVLPGQVV